MCVRACVKAHRHYDLFAHRILVALTPNGPFVAIHQALMAEEDNWVRLGVRAAVVSLAEYYMAVQRQQREEAADGSDVTRELAGKVLELAAGRAACQRSCQWPGLESAGAFALLSETLTRN